MKESEILIRVSIFSKEDKSVYYYDEIKEMLPKSESSYKKGDKKILSDGRVFPKDYGETSFNFELMTKGFDIEKSHNEWLNLWSEYFDILKEMKDNYGFKIHLNYEITVYDMHYPSMYFPVSFMSILSSIGIELSLYIYNNSSASFID